jgi:type II secretory pathway pseudopilin PulG
MTLTSRNAPRRGFTLVDTVVVVAILVLVAGVVVPIVGNELSTARLTRAQTDLKAVAEGFTRYFAHTGWWPSEEAWDPSRSSRGELTGYACLYENSHHRKGWSGPYLNTGVKEAGGAWSIAVASAEGNRGLVDPWGRVYKVHVYSRNGDMGPGGGMVLLSAGENGVLDTKKEQIVAGEAKGDDVLQVVTRRL